MYGESESIYDLDTQKQTSAAVGYYISCVVGKREGRVTLQDGWMPVVDYDATENMLQCFGRNSNQVLSYIDEDDRLTTDALNVYAGGGHICASYILKYN